MILRSKWPAATISAIDLDKALQDSRHQGGRDRARRIAATVRYYGEEIAAVCRHDQAGLPGRLARHRSQGRRPAMNLWSAKRTRERTARRRSGKARPNTSARTVARARHGGPGVHRMRRRHRGILHHAGADSSSHGNARQHGVLDGRGLDVRGLPRRAFPASRDGLAGPLRLDQSQVRVITDFMGGGFGSKFGARRRRRAGRAAVARGESAGPADAHPF